MKILEKGVVNMILFTDFIKVPDPDKTKVKFNMNPNDVTQPAWDLLRDDSPAWLEMNSWKGKKEDKINNLNHADYLIALAQYYPYGPNFYVFGGLYRVVKKVPEVFEQVGYDLILMEEYQEYIKRLVIKISKPIGQSNYNRTYNNLRNKLLPEVYEITPDVKLGSFPGYQNINLTHKELNRILSQEEPSWKKALSHVKGVYLIFDESNGKIYVGSASGNTDGIWQRWSSYADFKNPTGGNTKFVDIVTTLGKDHIVKNFRYIVLEIYDMRTKFEIVRERESFWQRAFQTRKFGYN